MTATEHQRDLLVLGVHQKSEAYPNTLYRLFDLQKSNRFRITELNFPFHFQGNSQRQSRLKSLVYAITAHLKLICAYLLYKGPLERAYIPYPAILALIFLGCLPKKRRPQWIVADAFISIYDTVVNDRGLIRGGSFSAKVLKWLEKRAYNTANKIIVDTPQNQKYMMTEFCLDSDKVIPLPLSTDEEVFKSASYVPNEREIRVLFIGTLVPLHGIETIAQAARLLTKRKDIQFVFIGDGQDAPRLAKQIAGLDNVQWEKTWKTSQEIAEEIKKSDICLGIFGGSDKAQRVCPLKLYAYASIGRAIVTGDTAWWRQARNPSGLSPFVTAPVEDSDTLARLVEALADEPQLRCHLAASATRFYKDHLSNQIALDGLINTITTR